MSIPLFPNENDLKANGYELARIRLQEYADHVGEVGFGITQKNVERLLKNGTGQEILECLLRAQEKYKCIFRRIWEKSNREVQI